MFETRDPRVKALQALTQMLDKGAAMTPDLVKAMGELNCAVARAIRREDPPVTERA